MIHRVKGRDVAP